MSGEDVSGGLQVCYRNEIFGVGRDGRYEKKLLISGKCEKNG